jgi:hypothetical protein
LHKLLSIDYSHYLHTELGKLAVFVVAILLMAFLVNFFLSRSIIGGSYRVFVAPGVIVHELSHAFLCLLTGAKIKSVSLFDKEGGEVQHGPSKIPVLGQILISIAPFVAGAFAIYFLSKIIGLKSADIQSIAVSKTGMFHYLGAIFSNLDFHQARTWIIFYIIVSIAVTMTPSKQDIKNIALSLLIIAIVSYIVIRFSSYRPSLEVPFYPAIFTVLGSVIAILILALIVSIIIYGISKLFKA